MVSIFIYLFLSFIYVYIYIIILIYIAYHCKCIDPWLTRNRRFCPICKRRVYGNNDDLHAVAYSSDTDSDEPNDRTPLVPSRISRVDTFRSFSVSFYLNYFQVLYTNIFNNVFVGTCVYSW